jgi:UDP-glucose 4-epimerase
MLNQLRFGRGVDNRRYKATGFRYRYTSREAVLKLGEHMRLHPIVRGAQEPYRYEREVEEFLRWSPHVRGAGAKQSPLGRDQLAELRRLLDAYADTARLDETRSEVPGPEPEPEPEPPPEPRPEPEPPASPVEQYDGLAAEEVISLLGSLDAADLAVLRAYEEANSSRESVLGAIDSVLARSPAPHA